MKRFWLISLAVLLIAAVSAPAFAWEFSLTGQHEYRLRYWSRTGNNDLFGAAAFGNNNTGFADPLTAGATVAYIGFAGPNAWGNGAVVPAPGAGAQTLAAGSRNMITRGGFSRYESDAIYPDMRLTFDPSFRINQAIRVHGVYNVGGIRNKYAMFSGAAAGGAGDVAVTSGVGTPPFERYIGQSALTFSSQDTIGIGSWEQVRATVQLPWGILSYGLKDFPYGHGLFTTYRLRGSAFVAVIPYGPFRFIPAFWEGYSTNNGVNTYEFRPEAQNKAIWFGGGLFTYQQGDFEFGGGWIGRNHHNNAASLGGAVAAGSDQQLHIWAWYFKYFNGRFFANAQYEWSNISTNFIHPFGTGTHVVPGLFPVSAAYNEYYHLQAELGAMAGPAKVTLMWAQASGPVLNNGNATALSNGINTNWLAGAGVNPKNYTPWGIDYQAMDPYQYLMFGVYGGGNQTFTGLFLCDDTRGMMSDAFAFALRTDYAVASNLNVWGSYLWAHRLENYGTVMGQYFSDGRSTLNGATAANRTSWAGTRAAFRANIGANAPTGDVYVPDGHIGWELGLGVDWKLLEGLTYRARYAYWQPGPWFQYAYQTVGPVAGGVAGTAADPSQFLGTRDAIQAFEGSLVIDF